jgi:GAF domain-containing protein
VPLEKTLNLLLGGIEAQHPEMLCSLLLMDNDGLHVRHAAAPRLPASFTRPIDGAQIGPCAGSCGTAAYRREPVIVEDIATDPLWANYRDLALQHDLRACWSTPIFNAQWRVLGTFALYFRTPARPTSLHSELIRTATYTASALLS